MMEFVKGHIFDDPLLSDVDVSQRKFFYFAAVRALALLHGVDWMHVDDGELKDFGKPGNYFARQLRKLKQVGVAEVFSMSGVEYEQL